MIVRCKNCLNTTENTSIKIDHNGICNVCGSYKKGFNKQNLTKELEFIKNYILSDNIDCTIGLSGGKDSIAMLKTELDMGFHPLTFSFQVGYNVLINSTINKIKNICNKMRVNYEVIDVHQYISEIDKKVLK